MSGAVQTGYTATVVKGAVGTAIQNFINASVSIPIAKSQHVPGVPSTVTSAPSP
jgi:hypothetical protein